MTPPTTTWRSMPDIDTTATRTPIHAYLDPSGHDGWHGFAAEQGASASALLQAMADCGTFAIWDYDDSDSERLAHVPLAAHMANVVARARAIDAARRRRKRDAR